MLVVISFLYLIKSTQWHWLMVKIDNYVLINWSCPTGNEFFNFSSLISNKKVNRLNDQLQHKIQMWLELFEKICQEKRKRYLLPFEFNRALCKYYSRLFDRDKKESVFVYKHSYQFALHKFQVNRNPKD